MAFQVIKRKSPYAMEQGILAQRAGNSPSRAGNFKFEKGIPGWQMMAMPEQKLR
jgi:hypothetical protein